MVLTPAQLKKIMAEGAAAPLKMLGQNYLIDPSVAKLICRVAVAPRRDIIVEVGPGLGALTEILLVSGAPVVAIEKDRFAGAYLKKQLGKHPNLQIIEADVLLLPDRALPKTPYSLVSSLPYNITTPFISKFLNGTTRRPGHMTLLLQREAAQRLLALPPQMNPLAFLAADRAEANMVTTVSPDAFWPKPKVHSQIVQLAKISPVENASTQKRTQSEFAMIEAAFNYQRKTIANITHQLFPALAPDAVAAGLFKVAITPSARPATLNIDQWRAWLSQFLK